LPGLGTRYVDPKTLPEGPFLGYDHKGRPVDIAHMVPIKNLDAHRNFDDLGAKLGHLRIDRTGITLNCGHAGVEEPHRHVVEWLISEKQQDAERKQRRRPTKRNAGAWPQRPSRRQEDEQMKQLVAIAGGLTLSGTMLAVLVHALPQAQAEASSAFNAAQGAQPFADHCAACHGTQGAGITGVFPPLAGNAVVSATDPVVEFDLSGPAAISRAV
jgi:mono/diheme cytochrome c family protein